MFNNKANSRFSKRIEPLKQCITFFGPLRLFWTEDDLGHHKLSTECENIYSKKKPFLLIRLSTELVHSSLAQSAPNKRLSAQGFPTLAAAHSFTLFLYVIFICIYCDRIRENMSTLTPRQSHRPEVLWPPPFSPLARRLASHAYT